MAEYATPMSRWFGEVWNSRQESAIDELLDENAVIHNLDEDVNGKEDFKRFYQGFTEAFPTLHVDVETIMKNDEYEATYCSVTGTTTEGKKVDFNGIVIGKFKDGKIVEGWNAFDFLKMQKQLG